MRDAVPFLGDRGQDSNGKTRLSMPAAPRRHLDQILPFRGHLGRQHRVGTPRHDLGRTRAPAAFPGGAATAQRERLGPCRASEPFASSRRERFPRRPPIARRRPAIAPAAPDSLPLRFDDVFRRYAPYVGALVLRLIGRPADVDDVVQDVFIQAHRDLSQLRDPAARAPVAAPHHRATRAALAAQALGPAPDRETGRRRPDRSGRRRSEPGGARARSPASTARSIACRATSGWSWVLRFVEGETLESIAESARLRRSRRCSAASAPRRRRWKRRWGRRGSDR